MVKIAKRIYDSGGRGRGRPRRGWMDEVVSALNVRGLVDRGASESDSS